MRNENCKARISNPHTNGARVFNPCDYESALSHSHGLKTRAPINARIEKCEGAPPPRSHPFFITSVVLAIFILVKGMTEKSAGWGETDFGNPPNITSTQPSAPPSPATPARQPAHTNNCPMCFYGLGKIPNDPLTKIFEANNNGLPCVDSGTWRK